jgi:hypothetical protein
MIDLIFIEDVFSFDDLCPGIEALAVVSAIKETG